MSCLTVLSNWGGFLAFTSRLFHLKKKKKDFSIFFLPDHSNFANYLALSSFIIKICYKTIVFGDDFSDTYVLTTFPVSKFFLLVFEHSQLVAKPLPLLSYEIQLLYA